MSGQECRNGEVAETLSDHAQFLRLGAAAAESESGS